MNQVHRWKSKRRGVAIAVAALVSMLGVTGFGPGSSSAGAAASTSADLAKANAAVAEAMKQPTKINQTVPLPTKPPKGKTIIFLGIEEPSVVQTQHAIQAAAEATGWNFSVVNYDVANPASLQAAFSTALAKHPTVVAESGVAPSLFGASTIDAYKKAGIPIIVAAATPVPLSQTILGVPNNPASIKVAGRALGNWFVADSKGKGDVLVEHVPGYPILIPFTNAFQQVVNNLCSACKVQLDNITLSEVSSGGVIPSLIAELKANPSINYLLFDNGDFATGINSALDAAGLNHVKVAGQIITPTSADALRQGTQAAWTGYTPFYQGYAIMDLALRYAEKQKVTSRIAYGDDVLPMQLLTKANVGNTSIWNRPANALQQFEKLWKVPLTKCTPTICGN